MTQHDTKQNSYRTENYTNRHEYDTQPSGEGRNTTLNATQNGLEQDTKRH